MYKFKNIVLAALLSALGFSAQGQTSNFSQYHLDPVFNSPGDLATSDYFQIMAHYRKQSLTQDQGFENMSLSGVYPLYYGGGRKFGAIGLGVLTESSGWMGMLRENSIRAGYAYSLQLDRSNFVSVGLQGGYYRRSIDLNKVRTDGQYQNGQYTPGAPTGENFSENTSHAFKADAGVSWYMLDESGDEKLLLGASAFNINRANYSFLSSSNEIKEPVRFQLHGSIRALQGDRYALRPTFRYMYEKNYDQLNVGALFQYQLQQGKGSLAESHLGLGAWYSLNNAAVLALQYAQPSYVLAISYDLPAAQKVEYSQVNNAIEISLGWRLNRGRKVKPKAVAEAAEAPAPEEAPVQKEAAEEKATVQEQRQEAAPVARKTEEQAAPNAVQQPVSAAEAAAAPVAQAEQPKQGLSQADRDRVEQTVQYTKIGDTELSAAHKQELDAIAAIMQQHPEMGVKVVGHSCRIGSVEANKRISLLRADKAKAYLLQKGIAADRVETEGKYYLEPIAPNDTEAGRQKNRRVEYIVLD